MVFLGFLKIFLLENKGFGVLKNERGSFLLIMKDFLLNNKGFEVPKKLKTTS